MMRNAQKSIQAMAQFTIFVIEVLGCLAVLRQMEDHPLGRAILVMAFLLAMLCLIVGVAAICLRRFWKLSGHLAGLLVKSTSDQQKQLSLLTEN